MVGNFLFFIEHIRSVIMNIGDTVEYYNIYNDRKSGIVTEIFSDMDSYDEMKLENGIPVSYTHLTLPTNREV